MPEKARAVVPRKPVSIAASPRFVRASELRDRIQELYSSIGRKAFELFENDGRPTGRDLENWLRAESELVHPVHVTISESDADLILRAEVPGFRVQELEISVEPRRVMIAGKRESSAKSQREVIYKDHCSDQVLKVIDLSVEVNATRAAATIKDGMLELTLPKIMPARKIRVEPKERLAHREDQNQDEEC